MGLHAAQAHKAPSPTKETNTMNAPLPEHIRKALETVMLDDNPHRGLHHNDTVSGAAGRSGFGAERACEGGAL